MSADEGEPARREPPGHDGDLGYHQRMVADAQRMIAYERALRRSVRPGDVVLDVGAGTGVLSLLAARLGARRVHAVESMAVGALIDGLARHNGLADRIAVQLADMRSLAVAEPVDVIVSDCLGRFLLDDRMLEAMSAACAWLRPGGTIIPARVELLLAPVELAHLPVLDTWSYPTLGLDLSPLERFAEHQTYPIACHPGQLLAAGQLLTRWTPPERAPVFDRALRFSAARAGRLRGLVGWFRAALTPEVELISEPGVETHWGQLLFPLPARMLAAGDRLEVELAPQPESPGGWRWTVAIENASGRETLTRQSGGLTSSALVAAPPAVRDVAALQAEAEDAWHAGDAPRAAAGFAAITLALDPRDPEGADAWENLGIAWHALGLYGPAISAFLRALDGDLTAREQSLRLLADSALRGGQQLDGARWLACYEARFGPHPAGWARAAEP